MVKYDALQREGLLCHNYFSIIKVRKGLTLSNRKISVGVRRKHSKASEEYIEVKFIYPSQTVDWDIPIEYRRTGTHLADKTDAEIFAYLETVYDICRPDKWDRFRLDQKAHWSQREGAAVTKAFFDVLVKSFTWKSIESAFPANPNWARRIQDLKEMGYTIATNTNRLDKKTGKNCTHLLLIPLPRGAATGYETWTPAMRARILKILGGVNAYEGKKTKPDALLPDHKFPEIRWDESTRREDLTELTDEEIRRDFQLLTNQQNLQKREVCRSCYQTGNRGYPFDITFFYEGKPKWNVSIPVRGEHARDGCVGCGWYDFESWRAALNNKLEG